MKGRIADSSINRTIKKRQNTLYVIMFQLANLLNFYSTNNYFQDSDTNPNTTASSVVGDAMQLDGRKRRSEATQLRKSVFGKKHNRLDESKVKYILLGNLLLDIFG